MSNGDDGNGEGLRGPVAWRPPTPPLPPSLTAYRAEVMASVEREGRRASDTKASNPKDIVGIRKAPMSTVSAVVMAEVGVAMLEGACKYGRHNYRAVGVRSSVYYDATMRHLMDWFEGENIDAASGMSHLTKAIASLFVLRDAMIRGKLTDDRPPSSVDFLSHLNEKAAAIIDMHADKSPYHFTIGDVELNQK